MSLIEGLLVFLTILIVYFILVIILHKTGVLEKYNISLWGPALLIRTKKGVNLLKKISQKRRFWKAFGSFGVVFCIIMMVLMVAFFILQAWVVLGFTPEQKEMLPGPEVALVLPGINPILPLEYLGYIILALVIAIIVHEFSHGILTFTSKLKVKSLGILYLVIPLGAFCEPDEKELKKAKIKSRMRIFAAGPMSNFVVVLIGILIFSFVFMSAVQPLDGAEILTTFEGTPADEINIPPGSRIINFNDSKIDNIDDFRNVRENTNPNQRVNITYIINGNVVKDQVKLISYYAFLDPLTDEQINESYINISFLGIGFTPQDSFTSSLKNPFTYDFPSGFIRLYALPILGYIEGYNPIASPFKENYEITGPLGVLPDVVFWAIVTALYWIFWLNIAVAIFNVLPIVPLDGGFLFNDSLRSLMKRVKKGLSYEQRKKLVKILCMVPFGAGYLFKDAVAPVIKRVKQSLSDEKQEKIVKNISLVVSLLVLFLAIFPFFIKYF